MGIRLFFCAVIFSCSVFAGLELRNRLYVRLRSLRSFREYFRAIKSNISHYGMSLDDIAKELAGQDFLHEFCRILRDNTSHSNYPEAFLDALKTQKSSLCLSEEDISFFCSVVNHISSADMDGAVASLEAADEQFSMLLRSAREKCDTNGKLRVVLCVSCGSVAALLFL